MKEIDWPCHLLEMQNKHFSFTPSTAELPPLVFISLKQDLIPRQRLPASLQQFPGIEKEFQTYLEACSIRFPS